MTVISCLLNTSSQVNLNYHFILHVHNYEKKKLLYYRNVTFTFPEVFLLTITVFGRGREVGRGAMNIIGLLLRFWSKSWQLVKVAARSLQDYKYCFR